ncbi:MAG: phosphotransferase [Deltaproteobacteria bacterium]|nr:phosphotransferase [Deltaproteobacteria bacterium]
MPSLIIATGLTREVISPKNRFLGGRKHVGVSESNRLLGRGREYGKGPLPAFLAAALADAAQPVGLVVVVDEGEGTDALVEPIAELARSAAIVSSRGGHVSIADLREAVRQAGGVDFLAEGDDASPLRVVVVGCDTDDMVLGLASLLHRFAGGADVAVCPHLVGSPVKEAHLGVLRHTLPGVGVHVVLDLADAARFIGVSPDSLEPFEARPCAIEPAEAREVLGVDARQIVELLCLHWTRASLRPLTGGFSGSLLFLADGWRGSAKTEPAVLKIDNFAQMRRELRGYYLVKDLLGKHVPGFGYPIARGDWMGVSMELAAMEGRPETLQDTFEEAETEHDLERFLRRLDKATSLLVEKLYSNTLQPDAVVPYRQFGLQMSLQLTWLEENGDLILGYLEEEGCPDDGLDTFELVAMLSMVSGNPDGVPSATTLQHGDLNFANIICDEGDNAWFIDWTHAARVPVELDFAKLENDVKFVMSKEFDLEDLPRLRRFEEYLLAHPIPGAAENLPESLRYAKWDLRYRKILETVRRIRAAYFQLRGDEEMLVYKVALLRYALHTLSFDQKRERGECTVQQLAHALHSVDLLLLQLVSDDYHLRTRSERPDSYPERHRVSIDEAPWMFDCEGYAPTYYVAPQVLAADRTRVEGAWADPEDFSLVRAEVEGAERDELGRPLNPEGRTGVAGRGLLGRWGANPDVTLCLVRPGDPDGFEIALGRREQGGALELPRAFVRRGELVEVCLARLLETECSLQLPEGVPLERVTEGYTYDIRQTDHAWVETVGLLVLSDSPALDQLAPLGDFDELGWWPLDAPTTNQVVAAHAAVIRSAVERLERSGKLASSAASDFLAKTG